MGPVRPASLHDAPSSMQELMTVIRNLKLNKACDDCGLSAAFSQHAPHALLEVLLDLFNLFFSTTGDVPSPWRRMLFRMLAKTPKAKHVGDYRPIANLRLLYKVFSYMILLKIEPVLDAAQPEWQLGFRAHRRMDEHLLMASIIVDKSRASNLPIWILGLDLSKAFDRVEWQRLWQALRAQGVSEQIVWILQCM